MRFLDQKMAHNILQQPCVCLSRLVTFDRSRLYSSMSDHRQQGLLVSGLHAFERDRYHCTTNNRPLAAVALEKEASGHLGHYNPTIPLPIGEVHLWWLEANEIHSPKLLEQYRAMLPQSEQLYVSQGASEGVRKERLLARTLVRSVLRRYCPGISASKDLDFSIGPTGKPSLLSEEALDEGGEHLHFNLTHTDRLLGVAVSRGNLVGVDAENSSRLTRANPVDLARRRFSPREFAVLTGFENLAEQQRLFIRLWCLKEAYVKATGRGILTPPGLRAFTFELLLNIKVRPSRRNYPSAQPKPFGKENAPPPESEATSATLDMEKQPWKYSTEELRSSFNSSAGDEAYRQYTESPEVVWNADSRVPFSLQFEPPKIDEMGWEAWLMELCGGHTAALVVESGRKAGLESDLSGEPKVQLKCFKTVPLVSEERAGSKFCRVIGYGRSTTPQKS